jgi:hypothetical protein
MKLLELQVGLFAALVASRLVAQSTCVSFPANFIPIASISYVTAANFAGDHLVVGVPAPGLQNSINANLPLAAFTNQTFCDYQVQLAPQQFFSNVYVPTAAEVAGNFSSFTGLLVNPVTNQPYSGGVIPPNQLGSVFAWRIGPAQANSSVQGWSPAGLMSEPRTENSAVLLPSGKVLVVGPDNTAELYDPATGSFTQTPNMLVFHGNDVSTSLLNDGRVLIVGGRGTPNGAEIYDPITGKFTSAGNTNQLHGFYNTATTLLDGRVLVVGGVAGVGGSGNASAGAEIYDPKTGKFTNAGAMAFNRNSHMATVLADGRVLITGGSATNQVTGSTPAYDSAEIFDPATGTFSLTGSMNQLRFHHYSILLSNGKVLIGGGGGGPSSATSAELYDPLTGRFSPTGDMASPRSQAAVALLSNGQVLVTGGYTNFPSGTSSV